VAISELEIEASLLHAISGNQWARDRGLPPACNRWRNRSV